ncbi:O-antigen ligase family protein [Vibrio japonicus]|uniref:O-antigen ligase family protein n=1 Tax=Vibrio japonicus TaxID=1824638 RepID=A0ABY5LL43_9VIBR|nr:O-antigen ligase family protein [Vibrio japonicus]UUM30485.1 O-antigen ligase family protein [Vibrio japonicus]
MFHSISKDKLVTGVFFIPLIWMATGMLWDGDGDMRLVPIVLLSMVVSISFYKFKYVALNLKNNFWIKLLVVSGVFGTIAYFTYGFDSRELRATLVVLFLLLILPNNFYQQRYFQWFLLLSSISCALYGYKFQFLTGSARGYWPINAIPYATICGLVLISSLGLLISKYHGKLILTVCTSSLLSFFGLVLSQSRGPLISIFVVLFFLIFLLFFFRSKLTLVVSLSFLVLCGFFLSKTSLVNDRISSTYNEYESIKRGEFNTSIGIRLQMYSIAFDLWKEKPILGYGKKIKDRFDELEREGTITPYVNKLVSMTFHNGYLDKFVLYGFFGGVVFLLFIIFPIYLSFQYSLQEGGFLLWGPAVFFSLCNLTDAPLINAQAAVYYLFFIGFSVLMLKKKEDV